MDFQTFDTRGYPTVSVRDGYGEWAASYGDAQIDLLDLRLLDCLRTVDWAGSSRAADLACGTGRTAAWLRASGVGSIDGVDLTPQMLERAGERGLHDRLVCADLRDSTLESGAYDLVVCSLADEHLPDLGPMYREAVRLASPNARFALVSFHPFFLMGGVPTHYHRPDGAPVAIELHVHLLSDHVGAAHESGWRLEELHESVVDDAWVALKPVWESMRGRPVSFASVWSRRVV